MADPEATLERSKLELTAIAAILEAVKPLDAESQKRVVWYVADLLGINSPSPRPVPQPGNVRRIPLPPGTNAQAVAESLRAAGVPAQG